MAITSLEVYGVIIAGWASQLEVRLPGALRAGADGQLRDRDGFRAGGGADGLGSMNMTDRDRPGQGNLSSMGLNFLSWNWLPLLPIFRRLSSPAWRKPTATRSTWSRRIEIVAGHMIEYSGMAFAMFFLAEYANMILVSMLTVIMFLGGWLPRSTAAPPFNWLPDLGHSA